jgi:hypothetical protein
MKSKLSLITIVAVSALAVAAPAAPAEPGPARDWFERAAHAAILDAGATPYVDALQRRNTVNPGIEVAPDWFERAAGAAIREASPTPYVDAVERREVTPVLPTTRLEVGVAFALGLALGLTLALGLVALTRFRPSRPLTQ